MRQQELWLSVRDRDRLKVLYAIERGHLRQRQGAEQLGVTDRWVRKLLGRVRKEGDAGVMHRLRGRPSNRKIPERVREKVMAEVRTRYADFGPTLAGEKLAGQGLRVSRETLRKWMSAAGLWQVRRKRGRQVHVWRERRAAFGELVMMDSSPFRWLEERGPKLHLMALIDDATSRFWGRLAERETTLEHLGALRDWLQRWGRPLALYTDKHSIFQTTRPVQWAEQLEGERTARTEFGRALRELGIGWIPAHSPQAKGRIERLFGTLQDRLVKEMRLAGVSTVEEANGFLQQVFVPFWEERFTVRPRQSLDTHRPLGPEHRLEEILSVRQARSIANDYTVRWQGKLWAIGREEIRAGWRGARIEVEQRLDGSLWARFRGSYLALRPCAQPVRAAVSPSGLRPPGLTAAPKTKAKSKYIPPPDHPWRRNFLSGRKPELSTLR